MTQLNTLFLLLILAIFTSCSVIKKQKYYYNQIIIRNDARSPLKNVVISVPKTQQIFSCSNIAPQGMCSNSFKKTRYQKNPIHISYLFQGRQNNLNNIIIEVPKKLDISIPIRGVLEIKPNGKILTYFEQNE